MISLLASKSCEKRSKGIEQTWCRASESARGDRKFAANAATPLQHASAGDSPPTTLLYFSIAFHPGTGGLRGQTDLDLDLDLIYFIA